MSLVHKSSSGSLCRQIHNLQSQQQNQTGQAKIQIKDSFNNYGQATLTADERLKIMSSLRDINIKFDSMKVNNFEKAGLG